MFFPRKPGLRRRPQQQPGPPPPAGFGDRQPPIAGFSNLERMALYLFLSGR